MNYLDLFSGIGGFALAARNAGWNFDSHYFSEIEPFGIQVYEKHFPQASNLGDIRSLDGTKLKEKHEGDWIVTGGFPCQDLSVAGKGAGINGNRSGLWFEMLRTIRQLQPKFVIVENVPVLLSQGLDRVVLSLSSLGYGVEWQVIPAYSVGLPHRRERVFIVAYPDTDRGADGVRPHVASGRDLEDEGQSKQPVDWRSFRADWSREIDRLYAGQVSTEPVVRRGHDGLSARLDRHRIEGLGNAIVPAIAEQIFRRLKEVDCLSE